MPIKEEAERAILLTVGLLALVGTVIMAIYVWDRPVETFLRAQSDAPFLNVAECVSILGLPLPYVGLAVALLLFWAIVLVNTEFKVVQRILLYRAIFILLGALIPWFAATGLQALFGRSRPHLYLERGIYVFHPLSMLPDFSSFPSAHTAVAAAMAAAFSAFFPSYRVSFFLAATLVAGSRIVGGYHFLSDTIAGMILGIAIIAGLERGFDYVGINVRAAVRPRWR